MTEQEHKAFRALEAENARLRAEQKRWRGNMHRKLGNLIGPEIHPHRELLCSSCSGKGTGLTCSECDTFDNEEMGRLVKERSDLRAELKHYVQTGKGLLDSNVSLRAELAAVMEDRGQIKNLLNGFRIAINALIGPEGTEDAD